MAPHTQAGEGHQCGHCKASFTTNSVLSVHMRDAHGDKMVTKKDLESNKRGRQKQQQKQNKTGNVSPFKSRVKVNAGPVAPGSPSSICRCHVCGKQFLTAANLKQQYGFLLFFGKK